MSTSPPRSAVLSARAVVARSRLVPLDLVLRQRPAYQLLRRCSLGASLLFLVGLPLWQLHALHAVTGLAPEGVWDALAVSLGFGVSPPAVGAPGAMTLAGLELVDPLLALGVAVAHGVCRCLLVALPALALVVVLGRFFCGWVCPYVPLLAASNALRWILGRLGLNFPDIRLPRRTNFVVLVAVLTGTAVLGTQLAPLIYPPLLIGREAFRAIFFGSLGVGVVVLGGGFAFDTFVSRAGFCRSLCPGGALFSLLAVASPVRVKRDATLCTDCTVCDVVCNLGQQPMSDSVDSGCERCGKCVSVCPTGALTLRFATPGKRPHQEAR